MRYSVRCYITLIVRYNAQDVKFPSTFIYREWAMKQSLSKSMDFVQKALNQLQVECQVLELPSSARTARDAASSIGCDVSQIVKSLIFKTQNTNKPVLILASGSNQVNEQQIEFYVGECIVKADAAFVREVTGFAIGGIPPIGHKNKINLIYIDQDLMLLKEVWGAAGTPNAVFCIKTKDLVHVTNGKIVNISQKS